MNLEKNSILITSAGRRTSLVRSFSDAAADYGWRLIAGDCDGLAPALYLAQQAIQLPPVRSADYIPAILRIVAEYSVRLIVPTIDTELFCLAQHAQEFQAYGCRVLVSDPGFVEIARDKWRFVQCYSGDGIAVPMSWLPEDVIGCDLPDLLFIKPRDGSASLHAFSLNRDELPHLMRIVPNAIVQERLAGPEITVDALLSLAGEPIHFVPRRRIRTLGGESIQGVTLDDTDLRGWILAVLQVAAKLGGRGPLTLQAFVTSCGPVLTEINPRFGGGFPLTLASGGEYPRWLLEELNGKTLKPRFGEYTKNLYMTRYYSEHFLDRPLWP